MPPWPFSGGQQLVRNDGHLGSHGALSAISGGARGGRSPGRRARDAARDGTWTDSTNGARTYVAFDDYSYLTPDAIVPMDNQDLHGSPAADLVIVTHPAFRDRPQRLATLHELFDGSPPWWSPTSRSTTSSPPASRTRWPSARCCAGSTAGTPRSRPAT